MGLLYNIAKWSVNKLLKQGVDLSNIVETNDLTKKTREAANILNNQLVMLQDEFALKRAEIIELQNDLIETVEPTFIRLLSESDDNMVKTTMTKIWVDKMTNINKAVDEHEEIVRIFTKKHEQLQKLESTI